MRISDWSSDVCSSDLRLLLLACKGGLDLPLALGRQALRLGLGAGDDLLGLLYRLALLALVAGEQRLRRSEELTSELQSLMRTAYAVFCLEKHIKYIF